MQLGEIPDIEVFTPPVFQKQTIMSIEQRTALRQVLTAQEMSQEQAPIPIRRKSISTAPNPAFG